MFLKVPYCLPLIVIGIASIVGAVWVVWQDIVKGLAWVEGLFRRWK